MANYSIKYLVKATPVEEVFGNDVTNSKKMIHSDIDKSFGGGMTIDCQTTSTNVKYIDYTTTVTDTHTLATAGLADGATFLLIKNREAGSTGTPDVMLRTATSDYVISVLSGVGDTIVLRNVPSGFIVANYELYSSSPTTLAKLDILYGIGLGA